VFKRGGMVFSEAESLASNTIVRREDSHCTTRDSDLSHGGTEWSALMVAAHFAHPLSS
jgi:hypothetical protein